MKKKNVVITIVAVVSAIIGWDIYLAADDTEGNTISNLVTEASEESPIIAFALGVLVGHWFWTSCDDEKKLPQD